MNIDIVSVGWNVEHEDISETAFHGGESLATYEVVLFDPKKIAREWELKRHIGEIGERQFRTYSNKNAAQQVKETFDRKREEVEELLHDVGGLLITRISMPSELIIEGRNSRRDVLNTYSFLPQLNPVGHSSDFSSSIIQRKGVKASKVTIDDQGHPFSTYLKLVCRRESEVVSLNVDALINSDAWRKIKKGHVYPIASNRADHSLALEVPVGPGSIVLLPEIEDHNTEGENGVLIQCIEGLLETEFEAAVPDWVDDVYIPGEDKHQNKIDELKSEMQTLREKKEGLQEEQEEVLGYKKLLYSKGKFILEPQVRRALDLFGFEVSQKLRGLEVDEEYDGVLYSDEFEGGAIVEVEGRDNNPISVDKYRQLFDKVDHARGETGENYTGLLVGNAYRHTPPSERENQFTEKALGRCKDQGYVALTTTQLYEAVKRILKQEDEGLKNRIRETLIGSSGLTDLTNLF